MAQNLRRGRDCNGPVDYGDPTPAVIRWPLGLVASAAVAWVTWWASGER